MPNNSKPAFVHSEFNILPSVQGNINKKTSDFKTFAANGIIDCKKSISPTKLIEKRVHLSPQSSCGSSSGSAFSSYCTTSCSSSTCSNRHDNHVRHTIRSEYSSTVSDSSIGSCMLSCESSDCSHQSKSPSNSCSNASSCSLTSNMSSLSDEQTDDTETKTMESSPRRMPTRSSMSNSDKSDLSRCNNRSYDSNNSSNTTKSSSTVVTAKVTRSTAKASVSSEALESYKKESQSQSTNQNDTNEKKKCLWHKCTFVGNATEVDDSLIAHIKAKHIFSQKSFRKFRCMWKGCSVYQKPSCHFNWLERHVVDHIDTKPFMCIFNGCRRKFRTEEAREKHCQCHINTTENLQTPATSSLSPVKTRNAQLLNTAKQSLIQNIKNKNNSDCSKSTSEILKSSKPLPNYSQILKTLTKKRKMQVLSAKKFKKAQFKDFIDDATLKAISNKLNLLNYESGTCTFSAEIIGSHYNNSTNTELFLVQWSPVNILENEWVDKNNLRATKKITLADLPKHATSMNPFYRPLRFRPNKRK